MHQLTNALWIVFILFSGERKKFASNWLAMAAIIDTKCWLEYTKIVGFFPIFFLRPKAQECERSWDFFMKMNHRSQDAVDFYQPRPFVYVKLVLRFAQTRNNYQCHHVNVTNLCPSFGAHRNKIEYQNLPFRQSWRKTGQHRLTCVSPWRGLEFANYVSWIHSSKKGKKSHREIMLPLQIEMKFNDMTSRWPCGCER